MTQIIEIKPAMAIEKFDELADRIRRACDALKNIVVTNDQELEQAKVKAKEANEVLKAIESKRVILKEIPLREGQAIDSAANELKNPILQSVAVVKQTMLAFEQQKERERLAQVAALRKAQEEKEAKDKAERERVARITNAVVELDQKGLEAIAKCSNLAEIDSLITRFNSVQLKFEYYQEKQAEANVVLEKLKELAAQKRKSLATISEHLELAQKLTGVAKEQAELTVKQELEVIEVVQEQHQLKVESAAIQVNNAIIESDTLAQAQKIVSEFETTQQIKSLTATKSKDVRKNYTYGISNILLVPREYLTIDHEKVMTAIKENKAAIQNGTFGIPGIEITQKESLVLR